MEDFDSLMKQAVSIKTGQMLQKRRKFESLPVFTKAGLYYLVKYANVRNQGFYQRYAVSDHLKARGNKLFKEEKVDLAVREYEQALSIFRYILNKNPNWKTEGIVDEDLEYINYEGEHEEEKTMATSIKVALYNNIAACYLSLGDFQSSKSACDEALLLDPTQAKALYRRSKALISDINAGIEEYKAALEDLKKALELSPDDSVIQQALNKVKHEMLKIRNSSQAFKGIFVDKKEKKTEEAAPLKKDPVGESVKKEIKIEQKQKASITENQSSDNVKKPLEDVGISKENKEENKKKEEEEKAEIDKNISKKPEATDMSKKDDKVKENELVKKTHADQPVNKPATASINNKENTKPSNEIEELEKLLERRGNELLRIYEASGRKQLADELRVNLRKAMAIKQRLEKITSLDFEEPNAELQEVAEKFELDLNDPDIKEELLKIQKEHIQEIRNWISKIDPNQQKVQFKPKKYKPQSPNPTATTNNCHSSSERMAEDPINKKKTMENVKEPQENDLYEDMDKIQEADRNSKSGKLLNVVMVIVAIIFFFITLYMQNGRKSNSNRHDLSKEI